MYNIPREFDLTKKYGTPKYSFGLGRDLCILEKKKDSNGPSPLSYKPYKEFGQESVKMSLYSRRSYEDKNKYTPGPGAYSYMSLNPNGRYADSNFRNSPKSTFGIDKSQRSGTKFNQYPGPGAYTTKTSIGGNGYVFDSNHPSNPGKSIGLKLSQVGRNIVITPGPGAYNFFSDFEGFSKK